MQIYRTPKTGARWQIKIEARAFWGQGMNVRWRFDLFDDEGYCAHASNHDYANYREALNSAKRAAREFGK